MASRAGHAAGNKTAVAATAVRWTRGRALRRTINNRRNFDILNRCLLTDDFSGVAVFDALVGEFGATPHAEVGAEDFSTRLLSPGLDLREIDPGDGGLGVVVEVPIVVEPEAVDEPPGAEVPGAESDIAHGAEVVDVLEGEPECAERGEDGEVSPDGDFPDPDEEGVEGEGGDGLEADGAHVAWVEGFEEGAGGPARRRSGR